MTTYTCPVAGGLRTPDAWGSGAFGASRGDRRHRGLDLIVDPGDAIYAPMDGTLVREVRPYASDPRYSGVLIRGAGGVEIKIFYVSGWSLGPVSAGDEIGVAQDLRPKYPAITNHVHVEVFIDGSRVDPTSHFQHCLTPSGR